jgi:2-dehydropantoate 2-reductase
MMSLVRYVVLGAGAVGSAVGALLADSGHEVALVARGQHAEAISREGLRVATPDRVLQLELPVHTDAAAVGLRDGDVLLLTTKTQQTASLLDAVARLPVGESSAAGSLPICCLQNGVTNERIAARRFADVYGVVVMMPAVLLEPGRVEAQGAPYSGLLDIGRWPDGTDEVATTVAEALSRSNFVSRAVADVMRWKYAKLLRNVGNALEALAGHDLDDVAMQLVVDLDRRAREEAEACFRAAGIDWASDDEWTARRRDQVQHALVEGKPRSGGSTWQSLARGAGSVETDYLNGEIVLLGREYAVPTPVNLTLQRLAAGAAHDQLPPGAMTPQEIEKEIRT